MCIRDRARRIAAWGDVEANLRQRLDVEGMTADADPDYATMRRARMDALRMVDLARLASQAKRKAKERAAEEPAEDGAETTPQPDKGGKNKKKKSAAR